MRKSREGAICAELSHIKSLGIFACVLHPEFPSPMDGGTGSLTWFQEWLRPTSAPPPPRRQVHCKIRLQCRRRARRSIACADAHMECRQCQISLIALMISTTTREGESWILSAHFSDVFHAFSCAFLSLILLLQRTRMLTVKLS